MSKNLSRKGSNIVRNPKHSSASEVRMHRLHRPWRSMPGTPKLVTQYLVEAGLIAKMPTELHDEYLEERFGHAAKAYLRSCLIDQYDNAEGHALMSADLDMALAIRSQFWGDRCEAFLSWFATAHLLRPGAFSISAVTSASKRASMPRSFRSRKSPALIGAEKASSVPGNWPRGLS